MNDILDEFFHNVIAKDFAGLMLGEKLGWGSARQVYAFAMRPDTVLKIETVAGSFQNIREWEFWRDNCEVTDIKRWLAPCVSISACGTILVQKRTTPVSKRDLPDKMPGFLTDLKPCNFGFIDERIVCHDYALHIAHASTRMRKANWRDNDT